MSFGGASCPRRLSDSSSALPRSISGLVPGSVVDLPLYFRSQLNPVVLGSLSDFARRNDLLRHGPDAVFAGSLRSDLLNANVPTVGGALKYFQKHATYSFGSTPKTNSVLSSSDSDNDNQASDSHTQNTVGHALVTINVFEGDAGGENSLSVNDSDDESGADPGEIRQFVCPNCGSQASGHESGGESEGENADETEAEREEDEGPDEDDEQEWEEEGPDDEQEGETSDANHDEHENEGGDEFGDE